MFDLRKAATAAEYHALVVKLRANRRGKPVAWNKGQQQPHHHRRRRFRRVH